MNGWVHVLYMHSERRRVNGWVHVLYMHSERGRVNGWVHVLYMHSERRRVNGWVHVLYMHGGKAVPIVIRYQLAPAHTIQSVFTDLKPGIVCSGMNLPSLPAQPDTLTHTNSTKV